MLGGFGVETTPVPASPPRRPLHHYPANSRCTWFIYLSFCQTTRLIIKRKKSRGVCVSLRQDLLLRMYYTRKVFMFTAIRCHGEHRATCWADFPSEGNFSLTSFKTEWDEISLRDSGMLSRVKCVVPAARALMRSREFWALRRTPQARNPAIRWFGSVRVKVRSPVRESDWKFKYPHPRRIPGNCCTICRQESRDL